jgi:hypothetical protein
MMIHSLTSMDKEKNIFNGDEPNSTFPARNAKPEGEFMSIGFELCFFFDFGATGYNISKLPVRRPDIVMLLLSCPHPAKNSKYSNWSCACGTDITLQKYIKHCSLRKSIENISP